jgi:hypothetical protein
VIVEDCLLFHKLVSVKLHHQSTDYYVLEVWMRYTLDHLVHLLSGFHGKSCLHVADYSLGLA